MNRRLLASLAAAAALILTPVAAQAYVAPGSDLTVTDNTPVPGQVVQVIYDGATIGEAYTLTLTSNPATIPSSDIQIAGTASFTRTATATSVTYNVTFASAGSYAAAITDSTGALVAQSTLVVAPAPAAGTGALAVTGSDPLPLGLGAAAAIALGAGAVVVIRRRRAGAAAE